MKITTRLQNHIITSIMLGCGRSFETIPFLKGDGTEITLELGDHIDATILQIFERFSANPIAAAVPSLL